MLPDVRILGQKLVTAGKKVAGTSLYGETYMEQFWMNGVSYS